MNKQQMVGIIISSIFCTSGVALGQTLQHPQPHVGSVPAPLTPALQASLDETYRLDKAAAAALSAGQYAEAEVEARQSMSVGHDSGLAQEILASALDSQGKKQEALQVYRDMWEHGNDHPRNLLPYALLLLNAGQVAQAVVAYNRALPTLADGKLVRDNSHFSLSASDPTTLAVAIHIALGLTYNWADDWAGNPQQDKAMKEYEKALQLQPDSGLANFYYGYGLQRLGRAEQAGAAFKKTIKIAKGTVKEAAIQALKKQKKPV